MLGAGIGGALGNAIGGSNASEDAANAQRAAAESATGEQARQFNITQQNQEPWRTAGETSLNKLMGLLQDGSITSKFAGMNPMEEAGYKFAAREGQRAIDNRASASGGFGGAALKAGARFAEENANKFYGDAFNRFQTERTNTLNPLFQIAGYGPLANQQVQQAGQNYANQAGMNIIGAGNANAANAINQGNIYGNLGNQLAAIGNRNNWWQTQLRT